MLGVPLFTPTILQYWQWTWILLAFTSGLELTVCAAQPGTAATATTAALCDVASGTCQHITGVAGTVLSSPLHDAPIDNWYCAESMAFRAHQSVICTATHTDTF
jgi:hypothetical protein